MWLRCLAQTMAQLTLLETQNFVRADCLIINERQASLDLTFGVETFDNLLTLSFGRFAAFQGKPAHALCMLLCVRATLPHPLGPNCDVIFVDGGNNFDPYSISDNSVGQGLDPEKVLERIHISRAFTHHQLASVIIDKLPSAIEEFTAKLIVVSDITQLYCDPDVRDDDQDDSLRIFSKTVHTLRTLARQRRCLIIATNLERRNPQMERSLEYATHVSVQIEQKSSLTRLTLLKHPHLQPRSAIAAMPGVRVLESFL
jgi:RecA/RadA recombinase